MKVVLTRHENPRSFLDAAGEMLYARETVNNLILGITEALIRDPQAYHTPFFATIENDQGETLLAAVMTPPHPMILAGNHSVEHGASELITYLNAAQVSLPGWIGPGEIAERFAYIWQHHCKRLASIQTHQRVYELRAVRLPPIPQGHFRLARMEDTQTLAAWFQAFQAEAMGIRQDLDFPGFQNLIVDGDIYVWALDGKIVSMAMKKRPIAHSITISGVYTPQNVRCQGYASALVARLSEHLLNAGYEFINLFTDLANPTSNKIYKKIGFHPVSDFVTYKFSAPNAEKGR